MPEFFGVGLAIRATLAKHVLRIAPIAQHHLFRKKDTPCDAIMENNFPWQHHWIPLDSFPNVPIKLASAFKHRHDLSKIGESKSTAWSLMYSGR